MEESVVRANFLLETEKNLVASLSEAEKFQYCLGRMQYLKYESGRENFGAADCSGSVCLALLFATGCSIRVTADQLYRKYFTKRCPDKSDIRAAFFITNYDRMLGNRFYKEDEVAHVAGFAGQDVVLNCVEPRSVLRSLSDMRPVYNAMDYRVEVRGLNREALQKASDKGEDLFGGDYQFMELRKKLREERI